MQMAGASQKVIRLHTLGFYYCCDNLNQADNVILIPWGFVIFKINILYYDFPDNQVTHDGEFHKHPKQLL